MQAQEGSDQPSRSPKRITVLGREFRALPLAIRTGPECREAARTEKKCTHKVTGRRPQADLSARGRNTSLRTQLLCRLSVRPRNTCWPWRLTNGLAAGGAGARSPSEKLLGARHFVDVLHGSLPTVIVGMPMTYDTHLLCQHGIRTVSIPCTLFDEAVIGLIRVQAVNLLYALRLSRLHSSPIECLPASWRLTIPLEPHSSVGSPFIVCPKCL